MEKEQDVLGIRKGNGRMEANSTTVVSKKSYTDCKQGIENNSSITIKNALRFRPIITLAEVRTLVRINKKAPIAAVV